MNFEDLHQQESPLIVCNVWDAASAKTAEKLNFKAIGTSSAAIATMLGYEDGEQMSFCELVYMVKRILSTSSLALTVDIEAGYSRNSAEIAGHIKTLADLGVVGINIEDSIVTDKRELLNAHEFSKKLAEIKQQLIQKDVDIFINVRTDPFLIGHPNALDETRERIKLYETTGIEGLFIPCITRESDISTLVNLTGLPLNVLGMPDLPDFEALKKLGVKRISMGNSLFDHLSSSFENVLSSILEAKSFHPVF